MASALVLFDVDGCTAIVDSKKLVLNGKDLVTGQKGHMKLGREELHVEILKVSDSKRFLNEFEDEWSTTHRSIALDKEKKKRKNRPGGYLSVWPQDMDDVVTPVEELPDPAEEQPKENEDVEVTGARKKTAARKTKEKAKEKSGTNGRKITVLHEGSGDYSTNVSQPNRPPCFLEELFQDEADLIHLQMRQQQQGQQSVSSQTDTVVILGPDDVLPSQNPPSYNNILKILKELQKSQQESKQMIQDLSKEMKEMKQNQQNTRMSIGSLLQTSKDLPELVVSNLLDVSVETAQGLEQCLHAKAATNSEETEKATVDQRKSAPVVLSTNTPLSSKTSSFRKTTTNRSVVRDIQVPPQTNQPEVISNPSNSSKVTSNNPTSNATSTSSPANKSNTSVSETTTTTETTSAPSNTECINQEPTATSATSVTTTSTDTTSTAYPSILESPDLANTSPTTCCTVNTASTNNTSCSSVITQPINTSTPVPSTNNTSCSSVITQPINTTPASTNNTSCSSVITQPINTTPVPSTLLPEDTTSPSPASQTSTAILTTIDVNQAAAILPASADTLIGRQSQPASTSSCAQKKSFKLNCFSGPIVEIEGPQDIQGIPENAEIRIKQKVTSEAATNACSKANFGWILAQQMYKREELMGRNVFGNRKNILPISPRRRHALEHAVAEVYGMYNQNMKEAVNGINTGLRSLRRRLPFTPQDPNVPM